MEALLSFALVGIVGWFGGHAVASVMEAASSHGAASAAQRAARKAAEERAKAMMNDAAKDQPHD